MTERPIGIMAAMPDELQAVLEAMDDTTQREVIALREFHAGRFGEQPCVATLSRIGKVAAAATAATMIQRFNVRALIVTGLAGGIAPDVAVGDVVIAEHLIQYDLDTRPLFPRFEAPLLGVTHFAADESLSTCLRQSAARFLQNDAANGVASASRNRIRLQQPRLHAGLIATGDRFVHGERSANELHELLPEALCVEMEGAAVAQVCHEHGVPFAVLRTISDRADQTASIDFSDFLSSAAGLYARAILEGALPLMPRA